MREQIIRDAVKARKVELERKLQSRNGDNAAEIRATLDVLDAEIETLEAAIAEADAPPDEAEELPPGEDG